MPVTIKPTDNLATTNEDVNGVIQADRLLEKSCPRDYTRCNEVIQSSFDDLSNRDVTVSAANNGLFQACHIAYSCHYHLVIRPEDVWFSILSQLSFYVNAHAQELRSFFVAHTGQKELEVVGAGTIYTADFGRMALWMTRELQKNLNDPYLCDWIMPDFSTTTRDDKITAAILMMGSLQKYFSYKMSLRCGLPSVTLLGEKQDWERIRERLDMLARLGDEPGQFGVLLRPVLENFVHSFDSPEHPVTADFWNRILSRTPRRSGPSYYTGWINAFLFWSPEGKRIHCKRRSTDFIFTADSSSPYTATSSSLDISGVLRYCVDTQNVPSGSISVPVTVDDNGTLYKTRMVAGEVGLKWSRSGGEVEDRRQLGHPIYQPGGSRYTPPQGPDTVQPLSGWWMYEVLESADKEGAAGRDIMRRFIDEMDERESCGREWRSDLPPNKRKADQVPFWQRPRVEITA